MEIQSLSCAVAHDKRLHLTWTTMIQVRAIQISVAQNLEFTQATHNFLLPEAAPSCILDLGKGSWFIRVGAWIGDSPGGIVKWSGTIGPVTITDSHDAITEKQSPYFIKTSKEIENGYRLFTANVNPNYMYVEVSDDSKFPAGTTKSFFMYDWGSGHIDVKPLNENLIYYVRYVPFLGYPTNSMVSLPTGNIIENVRALPSRVIIDHNTTVFHTQKKADLSLLQELKHRPNMRFTSQSDYLRYKAAKNMY
jgi:hypothetical protein